MRRSGWIFVALAVLALWAWQRHGVPAFLPPEAHDTLALVEAGGPFPYRQDGVVFQNREHRLPVRERDYYHEYTVETPGAHGDGDGDAGVGGGGPR